MDTQSAGKEIGLTAAGSPQDNPYVGPRAYTEAEAGRFHGREHESRDLLALVVRERLVLFYAQSGAGKSSLLHARLIPGLREQGFDVLPVARVSGDVPSCADAAEVANLYVYNLILSLNQGLAEAEQADPATLCGVSLVGFLAGEGIPASVGESVPAVVGGEPPATSNLAPTVLIVDQFEEILTTHSERWRERQGLFEQLRDALDRLPNLWVVLTLREDYVAALELYAELLPNRMRARFYMQRMGLDAALQAIEQPAADYGRPFAPGVAEMLVHNLSLVRVPGQEEPQPGPYVEPVQLQVVCYQLWENVRDRQRGPISEGDLPLGYIDQALTRFYEDRLAEALADPAAQRAGATERGLRTWFSEELITANGIRDTVLRNEATGRTGSLPNAAVDHLARRYLLRMEPRAGAIWVELVHDRFVAPILEANRAWFERNRNPVTQAAEAWRDAGRPSSALLRGERLAEAKAQLQASPDEFSELERDLIAASQDQERRSAARRQRLLTLVGVTLVALFAALAYGAWLNARAARESATWADYQTQLAVQAKETADAEARRANEEAGAAVMARQTAEAAQVAAVEAEAETRRLSRSIRADQLTANGLKVSSDDPPLALLLAVEGLRVQHSLSETVASSAQTNMHALLDQVGGMPLRGHETTIWALAYSPDGRWLATGSADHTLRLWDMQNPGSAPITRGRHPNEIRAVAWSPNGRWLATGAKGKEQNLYLWDAHDLQAGPMVLGGHGDEVLAVAWSPDSRWLASASVDKTARLWDVGGPTQMSLVLEGHTDEVRAVAFSPDGRWLATASKDKTARLWDVAYPRAEPVILAGHTHGVNDVAFSPDGRWLATASWDKTVRLWDMTSPGRAGIALVGHADEVWMATFSPDGRWLASASKDKTARVWDVTQPDAAPAVLIGHTDWVKDLAWSPDGRWLATASADRTARLWDRQDPSKPPSVLIGHARDIEALAFGPAGRWLVTASADATLRLWDAWSPSTEPAILVGHERGLRAVAYSPDGRWLATASEDRTARLWDMQDPGAPPTVLSGHEDEVRAVAYSPDGRWLATGSDDRMARLWDMANPGAAPIVLSGHAKEVLVVAFSPDGRWLVTGSADRTARLWDMTYPGASSVVLSGHEGEIRTVAFSPDGRWLATGSADKTVRLWDMTNPASAPAVLAGHESEVMALAFRPDGRWLATASADKTVRLWDVAFPMSPFAVLYGHDDQVWTLAFSPDGRWLATGSRDKTVRLWDMGSPSASPIVLAGHKNWVHDVAFSPDSRWLASASADRTVRLWEVGNPSTESVVLTGHSWAVVDVAFSPDGRRLATASGDRTARLWRWQVDDLVDLACRTAGRNLSSGEWSDYFGDEAYRRTCEQWP